MADVKLEDLDERKLLEDIREMWSYISYKDKLILLGKVEAIKELRENLDSKKQPEVKD